MLRVLTLLTFVASILVPLPPPSIAGRNAIAQPSAAGLVSVVAGPRNQAQPGERRAEPASSQDARGPGSGGSPPPEPGTWSLDELWPALDTDRLAPVPAVVIVCAACAPAASAVARDVRPRIRTRRRQPAHSGIEPARA